MPKRAIHMLPLFVVAAAVLWYLLRVEPIASNVSRLSEFTLLTVMGGGLLLVEMLSLTVYLLGIALACFVAGGAALLAGSAPAATALILGIATGLFLPLAHIARRALRKAHRDVLLCAGAGTSAQAVEGVERAHLRVGHRGRRWGMRPRHPGRVIAPGEALRIEGATDGDDPARRARHGQTRDSRARPSVSGEKDGGERGTS